MYSWEIEEFLKQRDHIVTPEECMMIINPDQSNQITTIKYYACNNEYQIQTNDGYYFIFFVKMKEKEIE